MYSNDKQYANPFADLDESLKSYIDTKFNELKNVLLQSAQTTPVQTPDVPQMISTKQCCEMMGMSWQTLKKHFVDTNKLVPINNNGKFYFSHKEVVDFIQNNTKSQVVKIEPQLSYKPRTKAN